VLTHPRLPRLVAADAVEHNWTSYSQTLTRVILDAGACAWLDMIDVPVEFVAGGDDPVVDRPLLLLLADGRPRVTVALWPGRHDLPLVAAERCAATIADCLQMWASPPA